VPVAQTLAPSLDFCSLQQLTKPGLNEKPLYDCKKVVRGVSHFDVHLKRSILPDGRFLIKSQFVVHLKRSILPERRFQIASSTDLQNRESVDRICV